jgi:5-methylcytosine-specific restriction endonuclease McrA
MPLKQAKGDKGKCDKIFSQIIRMSGECLNCRKTTNLQCAHIVSRRFAATRTDLQNAYCLCAGCHQYFTAWPREFSKFITKNTGSDAYERLKLKAETVTKVDWSEELIRLQAVYKDLQSQSF